MSGSRAMPSGPTATRWTFARLLHAPHRLAFFAGASLLGVCSAWWAIANLSFGSGGALRWSLAPALAHGVLMTWGFMPLFFAGFLFAAFPKWLALPAVPARKLLPGVLTMVAGLLVFLAAVHAPSAALGRAAGGVGLCAVFVGWMRITADVWILVDSSRAADRLHTWLIVAACVAGALTLGTAAMGIAAGLDPLVRAAVHAALWGFNGIVFVCAIHRMIPFFAGAALPALDAWRPLWLLGSLTAVFSFEAFAQACEALGLADGRAWALLRAGVELPAGLGLAALAVRWAMVQSLKPRLLAMLHAGFTWLGVALLMAGASHAGAAVGAGGPDFGLAPLHAYTMGFLGTTMFAMVARVSCGHSGRALVADDFLWRLFWLLQAAVALRIAAALAAGVHPHAGLALAAAAAVGWAATFVCWSSRYGRWYGIARFDGRPG